MKITIFDTETTGLPLRGKALREQPYVIQFASQTYEYNPQTHRFVEISRFNQMIKPLAPISADSIRITGITEAMVANMPTFAEMADQILAVFQNSDIAIAHNLSFDREILSNEFERLGLPRYFLPATTYDSMEGTRDLCKLPGKTGYKAPRLMELHQFLLNESFPEAHNAEKDVTALANCVQVLLEKGIYRPVLNQSVTKREIPVFEQTSLF